ncbi:hypothetical protein AAFF_G00075340 [Aldrovandia affinis]|uniref:Uncharacterized protein n=1 Tax=Aldrovandia affinis TaxID=143900 RepID=A0AAD7RXW0_9TELE|nr:hypothetical protein AAFF_G00075340 [Aldrovandia affinis]
MRAVILTPRGPCVGGDRRQAQPLTMNALTLGAQQGEPKLPPEVMLEEGRGRGLPGTVNRPRLIRRPVSASRGVAQDFRGDWRDTRIANPLLNEARTATQGDSVTTAQLQRNSTLAFPRGRNVSKTCQHFPLDIAHAAKTTAAAASRLFRHKPRRARRTADPGTHGTFLTYPLEPQATAWSHDKQIWTTNRCHDLT